MSNIDYSLIISNKIKVLYPKLEFFMNKSDLTEKNNNELEFTISWINGPISLDKDLDAISIELMRDYGVHCRFFSARGVSDDLLKLTIEWIKPSLLSTLRAKDLQNGLTEGEFLKSLREFI